MDKKQAEQIIRQACASFVGNLKDHQSIQDALNIIFEVKEPEVKK